MTLLSLTIAAGLGAAVGLLGHLILQEGRLTSPLITVTTSATAAVLGTAAARTVSAEPPGPVLELFAAVLFGAVGAATTIYRLRARRRHSSLER